jgi:uncharacterized protein (TIGR02118 family)
MTSEKHDKHYCATVLYPHKEGSSFDFEYYAGTLAPMYVEFLGDNCIRFEVRKGLMTPGKEIPDYICIASYWVKSREKYSASLSDPRFEGIMKKFSAFTDIEPIRQFDEVVASTKGSVGG